MVADKVTIVGYTGPFESDWSTSNNVCGVLFTIEDDVNHTDDEIEVTFGQGADAEIDITITLTEYDLTETEDEEVASDEDDSYNELIYRGFIPVVNDNNNPVGVRDGYYYGAHVFEVPPSAS